MHTTCGSRRALWFSILSAGMVLGCTFEPMRRAGADDEKTCNKGSSSSAASSSASGSGGGEEDGGASGGGPLVCPRERLILSGVLDNQPVERLVHGGDLKLDPLATQAAGQIGFYPYDVVTFPSELVLGWPVWPEMIVHPGDVVPITEGHFTLPDQGYDYYQVTGGSIVFDLRSLALDLELDKGHLTGCMR